MYTLENVTFKQCMNNPKKTLALENPGKKYISQSDIPAYSLVKAIKVSDAIVQNFGNRATKPMQVALAMDLGPQSSHFRQLCGAALAYGLTDAGYAAELIGLTETGKQISAPTAEGRDIKARKDAVLKPRIVKEFLTSYNNSSLPPEKIALNVLEEMGVSREKSKQVYDLIIENAKYAGFLKEQKGKNYVDLEAENVNDLADTEEEYLDAEAEGVDQPMEEMDERPLVDTSSKDGRLKKVFITHGKDRAFIDPIKKLLAFGELEAVVAVEKTTVSRPVPGKVMDEMRSCGAAIIHVDIEKRLMDADANEHSMVNQNVLIEIGAAMALYGERFVLLVKDGTTLPSNLQGLLEVRYSGEELNGEVTIKLLEAIKDIKNHPLP